VEFNKEQLEIIESIEGAFLISAPVGTGKTTVLAERVIKALEKEFKPEEILCLTFTNRAAEEMSERIRKRLKNRDVFRRLTIKTFHGFCAYFVKAEAKKISINPDFIILDDDERLEIMKGILEKYPDLMGTDEYSRHREINSITEKIYDMHLAEIYKMIGWKEKEIAEDAILQEIDREYMKILDEQNALDYNGLVTSTINALYFDEELKNKWSKRYRLIQLDEFQDTHTSEYLVIKQLAREHKNLALIGDLDQTIYGWRGSKPLFIADQFKKHFAPVKEFYLEVNYRFSPGLLKAVKSFLFNIEKRQTKDIRTLKAEEEGAAKSVDIFQANSFREEVSWAVENIKELKHADPDAHIAVLARTNGVIKQAAQIFEEKGIAHVTVDKYDFFRRQEIKDVFAYLKILFNKYDLDSAYRIVLRPSRNIGTATLRGIREEGKPVGLKISDFLVFKNYNMAEPFEGILNFWQKGRIIVLDTETTGTDPMSDEIIQIYALEIVNGIIGQDFHYYIKNKKSVGLSYDIHGLTDEFLKNEGHDVKEVLNKLKGFISDSAVIGHNVNFDLAMIIENGKRNSIIFDFKDSYDTLDISKRLVASENYKLNTLASKFGLEAATHSADDDVRATAGLLAILIGKLEQGKKKRREIFRAHAKKFIPLAQLLSGFQKAIRENRPHAALKMIWEGSGLNDYYEKDKEKERRLKSLETLVQFFENRDEPDRRPEDVLQELLYFSSLARNIDFLGLEKGKIPVITVHQAKGLEFDYVIIVGVNETKFPVNMPNVEEEVRLFYVALTRARKKVLISFSMNDNYGRSISKSRFIDFIDQEYLNYIR
jgi:DNA helicase II / ATP-dependent DNA helicase PcrA